MMPQYELLGGSPHAFVFDVGTPNRPVIPPREGLNLRATVEDSRSLGSLALEISPGVVLELGVNEMEFGELDDKSGAIRERLAALTAEQVVLGSPLGVRAAHQSTEGQLAVNLGIAGGYHLRSRLRRNHLIDLDAFAKNALILQPRPVENPVPIAGFSLDDGNVRPLINCTRDPVYIRGPGISGRPGKLHPIQRLGTQPLTFSLSKKIMLGEGQDGIPVVTRHVSGIKGIWQLELLPPNPVLLVYSEMLSWLDVFAPEIASLALCGGTTERDEATESQLPIIQSLLRYGRKTIQTAHRIGR